MENSKNKVGCEVFRSKEEEYRIIDDLTGFDNIKAMLEAEAILTRRKGLPKRKRQKKNKTRVVYVPVCGDAKGEEAVEKTIEESKTELVQTLQEHALGNISVDATNEKKQEATLKKPLTAGDGFNNGAAIDLNLPWSEGSG